MAPISFNQQQERTILYSSHGTPASKFSTDGLEKEFASARHKDAQRIKNGGAAKMSRIPRESKSLLKAATPGSNNVVSAHTMKMPASINEVLVLPNNFIKLVTMKADCLNPLDKLCKALRVPYSVLEAPSVPHQARGPTVGGVFRRNELSEYSESTLQSFETVPTEEYADSYADSYEVSVQKVEPVNQTPAQSFWHQNQRFIIPLVTLAALFLLGCLIACVMACVRRCCRCIADDEAFRCVGCGEMAPRSKEGRRLKKLRKAEARQARQEAGHTVVMIEGIELEDVDHV